MKSVVLTLLLLLTTLGTAQAEERLLQRDAIEVEDGDTLVIDFDGTPVRVQLIGIDAPEDRDNPKFRVDLKRTGLNPERLRRLGRVATEQLRFLVDSRAPLTLQFDRQLKDRYGRMPADLVDAEGNSLAAMMIANGYAMPVTRNMPASVIHLLGALAREARTHDKGLWGLYPEDSRRWAGVGE